jgi:hypothetical protein
MNLRPVVAVAAGWRVDAGHIQVNSWCNLVASSLVLDDPGQNCYTLLAPAAEVHTCQHKGTQNQT